MLKNVKNEFVDFNEIECKSNKVDVINEITEELNKIVGDIEFDDHFLKRCNKSESYQYIDDIKANLLILLGSIYTMNCTDLNKVKDVVSPSS